MEQLNIDDSYLNNESYYKKSSGDYFIHNGEIIRDYKGETIDPYSDVFKFDDFYFEYGDTDNFIEWLIEKHIYSPKGLFKCMTLKGQRQFLLDGFNDDSCDFLNMFDFEPIEPDEEI